MIKDLITYFRMLIQWTMKGFFQRSLGGVMVNKVWSIYGVVLVPIVKSLLYLIDCLKDHIMNVRNSTVRILSCLKVSLQLSCSYSSARHFKAFFWCLRILARLVAVVGYFPLPNHIFDVITIFISCVYFNII